MTRYAEVLKDNEHLRLPNGEPVKFSRHEVQRAEGQFGGEITYPATTKYDTRGVPWTPEWYAYMAHPQINTLAAVRALMRNNGGLFNSADNRDVWPGGSTIPPPPWAEAPIGQCVVTALNAVEVLEVKNGRAFIRVFEVRQRPPDPALVNPRTMPWLFDRFRSVDEWGNYGDAPDGIESYIPRLSRDGQNAWLPLTALKFIEKPTTKEVTTMKPLPKGKSIYLHKIAPFVALHGSNEAAAKALKAAGFEEVWLKVTDGRYNYNQRPTKWNSQGISIAYEDDLIEPFVAALKAEGLRVVGWGWVYGSDDAKAQATAAANQVKRLGLTAFVVNAEADVKGYHAWAKVYAAELRRLLPDTPLGLSSYKWPSYHPELPWRELIAVMDFHAPQVYHVGRTDPAAQLVRSVKEWNAFRALPVIPTGAAYAEHGWQALAEDVNEFHAEVMRLGLPGWNYWEAYWAVKAGLWPTVAAHKGLAETEEPKDEIPTPPDFEEIPDDPADPDEGKIYYQAGFYAGQKAQHAAAVRALEDIDPEK